MADMDRIFKIKRFDKLRQIVGVSVQVVAVPRLARAAMTAAVMRDATVAARGQKKHLVFKSVRAEGPAMAEDDGLSRAPVFEVDLRSVFGGDRVHVVFSFLVFGCLHS